MFNFLNGFPTLNNFNPVQMNSFVRILHASPDAPPVDVYANSNLIARNLAYKNFTQYLPVPAGKYNIKIFPAGTTTNPVIDTSVNVAPNSIYTVAAKGTLNNISLLPIPEPKMPIPPGKTFVRFIHLSPNAPNVDITFPDGTILFRDVAFEEIEEYLPVNPGKYTLQARVAGTENVVLTVPNINLKPDRFYSVYAIGLVNDEPPLQVLIPLDGNSYINF